MTREEKIQQMLDDWVSVKICEKAMIDDINEIYDDFESRTCENCKHLYSVVIGSMKCSSSDTTCTLVDKDFGCNKFEPKDDSTHIGLDGKETTKWGM